MSPYRLNGGDVLKFFKRDKSTVWIAIFGAVITLVAVFIYLLHPRFFTHLDFQLYDFQMRYAKAGVTESMMGPHNGDLNPCDITTYENQKSSISSLNSISPVIVDIDESSLRRIGQWPWPRYYLADLLQRIHDGGALAIGVDMLFAEPDQTSPELIRRALYRQFGLEMDLSGLPSERKDNDLYLGHVMKEIPAALGYYFQFETTQYPRHDASVLPELKAILEFTHGLSPDPEMLKRFLFQPEDVIPPLAQLFFDAGFMNIMADEDGIFRRAPLIMLWNDRLYPQLALATLMKALNRLENRGDDRGDSPADGQGQPVIRISAGGIESIHIGNGILPLNIPLGEKGQMLLNFRGPARSFPYISAADILQLEPELSNESDFSFDALKLALEGNIIFVGSSAVGLKDLRSSPLDLNLPGIEVHATIVDNILRGNSISRPDWIPALELLLTVLCGLFATLSMGIVGPKLGLMVTMALAIAMFEVSQHLLTVSHIRLSVLYPMLTLILHFMILNLAKYGLADRDKRYYRKAFGKYVSKGVVEEMITSPKKLTLDGSDKPVTILFSDIRGFSTLSEQISPSDVSALLQDYFTPMTQVVLSHSGTLDKFIGDALMCFWNAPLDVEHHETKALAAALDIRKVLGKLRPKLMERYGVEIKTGIGLHTGVCCVGNMGSADLFDYTIIGDDVNLASRIEGLTKYYGVDLLLSQSVKDNVALGFCASEGIFFQEVDTVQVKGKSEPVTVYLPRMAVDGQDVGTLVEELARHNEALAAYQNGNFSEAWDRFSNLEASTSALIYTIYKERAVHFMENPPDENWDGVFIHISK